MVRDIRIQAITVLILLVLPTLGFASTEIKLKNGSGFITNQYWEEGGQICFNMEAGIVRLPKSTILDIRDTDIPYIESTPSPEPQTVDPEDRLQQASTVPSAVSEIENRSDGQDAFDLKRIRKENRVLKARLSSSLADLRKATREKDSVSKAAARDKIRKTSRQIYQLADTVKERLGSLPSDWWENTTQRQ